MNLNESQINAIHHQDGPMLVVAGPGSGKTTVITRRVLFLCSECKVPAKQILTVTFSCSAAEEMAERFRRLCRERSYSVVPGPRFGTFHSVFYQMLKQYDAAGCPEIISETDRFRLLYADLSCLPKEESERRSALLNLLRETGIAKNSGTDLSQYVPRSVPTDLFRTFNKEYQRILSDLHRMDFDDILLRTHEILKQDSGCLRFWQEQFRYIQIDEFQDVNKLQYRIIKLLASPENNLAVIGDDDQSIYGFRGADPGIMQDFIRDYPLCRRVTLTANYRCPEPILTPAQKLIRHNLKRLPKALSSSTSPRDKSFTIRSYKDPETQYLEISRQIRSCLEQGIPGKDIAVLFRQHQDIPYAGSILKQYQIPCHYVSDSAYLFRHFICRDVNAYLKTALKTASRQDLLRIINRPDRSISRYALPVACDDQLWNHLSQYYRSSPAAIKRIRLFKQQMQMLALLNPFAAITYILKVIGYESFLHAYAAEKKIAYSFLEQITTELLAYSRTCSSLQEFLNKEEDSPANSLNRSSDTDAVQLMTMHACKGLEFPVVFIPGLNQGILPSAQASQQETEEERRLLYVAMTRAKQHLHISYTETIRSKHAARSVFLDDIISEDASNRLPAETGSMNRFASCSREV